MEGEVVFGLKERINATGSKNTDGDHQHKAPALPDGSKTGQDNGKENRKILHKLVLVRFFRMFSLKTRTRSSVLQIYVGL